MHFGAFDFDDLHHTELAKVLVSLANSGVAHLVLSTWSHTGRRKNPDDQYRTPDGSLIPPLPGAYFRLRILVPFSRAVAVSDWPRRPAGAHPQLVSSYYPSLAIGAVAGCTCIFASHWLLKTHDHAIVELTLLHRAGELPARHRRDSSVQRRLAPGDGSGRGTDQGACR